MNKDKIIKDLKERNDKLANQRRQFEIRLINEQYLVEKKDKEIERLNNIIDELEKDLTKVLEDMYNSLVHIDGRGYYSASLVPLEDTLEKLKELKGSGK